MAKALTVFDVLKEMGERDLDVALSTEVSQVQSDKKRGGSRFTMGIAGDNLTTCFALGSHRALLVVYNTREYREVLAEMQAKRGKK